MPESRELKRIRYDVNCRTHRGIAQFLMNYIQIKQIHLEMAAYANKYLEIKTFSPTIILKIIPVSKRPNTVGRYINKGILGGRTWHLVYLHRWHHYVSSSLSLDMTKFVIATLQFQKYSLKTKKNSLFQLCWLCFLGQVI